MSVLKVGLFAPWYSPFIPKNPPVAGQRVCTPRVPCSPSTSWSLQENKTVQAQFPWVIRAVVSRCSPKNQQSLFLLCFSSCAMCLTPPSPAAVPPGLPRPWGPADSRRWGAGSWLGGSSSPWALLIPILLQFLVNFSPGKFWDWGKPGWALFIISRAIYRAARRNRGVSAHVFRGENGCICKSKSDLVQHSSS